MTFLKFGMTSLLSMFLIACGSTRNTQNAAAKVPLDSVEKVSIAPADSAHAFSPSSLPPRVSQQEIQWALQLEQRVLNGNHQPTPEETAQYQDIASRLAGAQTGPARHADTTGETVESVTQQELQWALDLEKKVSTEGYRPNAQETAAYENIFRRMQEQQDAPQPTERTSQNSWKDWSSPYSTPDNFAGTDHVTKQEMKWAVDLQTNVQKGYEPTKEEVARYTDIYNRMQTDLDPSKVAPTGK